MPTDPPPFPDLEQIHIEAHRAYQRTPGSGATAVANAIRAAAQELERQRAAHEPSREPAPAPGIVRCLARRSLPSARWDHEHNEGHGFELDDRPALRQQLAERDDRIIALSAEHGRQLIRETELMQDVVDRNEIIARLESDLSAARAEVERMRPVVDEAIRLAKDFSFDKWPSWHYPGSPVSRIKVFVDAYRSTTAERGGGT